ASSISYQEWVAQFDAETPGGALILRRRVRAMLRQPVISVVLPVYNPDLSILAAAIESVKHQTYQHWELCIADDASTNPDVRPFLEAKARADSRIKLVFRETNGHISACSNSAIALATGQWCALLDQDDTLAANALAVVALDIEHYPDTGLFHSDEDKIDATGRRSNPFFKTDWNPELFLEQNFGNHIGVYQAEVLVILDVILEGFKHY